MFEHTKELFKRNKFLIMYQQNNFKNVICMHDLKLNLAPNVFRCSFNKASIYIQKDFQIRAPNQSITVVCANICAYRISVRGPWLWNEQKKKKRKVYKTFVHFWRECEIKTVKVKKTKSRSSNNIDNSYQYEWTGYNTEDTPCTFPYFAFFEIHFHSY